ncbi:GH92 family glycosyl hydrolase [Empedobacter falsenii]|uniref:GH92 family glycosyl hydrolase n=1 Tax=Empedobacter falsenii TaxID=343874 RepID=UPI0005716B47|nr:GH92 family glycosyl hydrolase [Empedobacter falsenii]
MKSIKLTLIKILVLLPAVYPLFINAQKTLYNNKEIDPVDLVNPLMGTDSKYELSNGNTYPAIGLPWGMNLWTAQTGKNGNGWQYQYSADKIRGLKQTHQPSPWMNDYGQFSLMPTTGSVVFDEEKRASWFSHKTEVVKPYYYSVYLADYDVVAEMTPTERAAIFRFTFNQTDHANVVIDAFDKGSYVKYVAEKNQIIGYSTRYSRGDLKNFKNYFIVQFDTPIKEVTVFDNGKKINKNEISSKHAGIVVSFGAQTKAKPILAKVSSSFISDEQAATNLKELKNHSFEQIAKKGRKIWNDKLGQLAIESDNLDEMKTFYSTLYRTLFFPNKLYEIDEKNNVVHYSPYNGKVLPGYLFGGTGFWDTFRALYPFLNLVYPSINVEMQEGLANAYKEGGFLPEWSSPGYADIMIGNNSASVVTDAYMKGLRGYDINTLYEALLHGANNEGPMSAVGRKGAKYYNDLGYVPYDVGINENAARTLEYAYDDFTIYQLGKVLGRPKAETDLYKKRSMNYKNLFDHSTGFMRGKNKDGKFQSPFNPLKWGDAFTEGNSWHYTWSVFHDVQGLIDLMGGDEKFISKLDSVFLQPPLFDDSYYGQVIHEIREMQIVNMGQYAHGNQPIQHMIYLYNYAGEPWKAQFWTREVMKKLYAATPDGYCGDEDNGQTSAWYVFSALGFYPVTPAVDEYVIGSPLFKKATIYLENGRKIQLMAEDNSNENIYIKSVELNDKKYTQNFFKHSELMKGAKIEFNMNNKPNKNRGTKQEDRPYSLSVND